MSRSIPSTLVLMAAATALHLTVFAPPPAEARGHGHSFSADDERPFRGCEDVRVRLDDLETARRQQTLTIPAREVKALRVAAEPNGGVRLEGWDRDEFLVTACLTAGGDSQAEAEAALAKLSVERRGDDVVTNGPRDGEWNVFLVVQAPRRSTVSIETENGPVTLREMAGNVTAETENGPLSLVRTAGMIRARTTNGPVSVLDGAGDLDVSSTNGPLSVRLAGKRWEGRGLKARTSNGPVTLQVPEDYESATLVTGSNHAPLSCRAAACAGARKEADGRRRVVELNGAAEPVVSLSTQNGPISVKDRPGRS